MRSSTSRETFIAYVPRSGRGKRGWKTSPTVSKFCSMNGVPWIGLRTDGSPLREIIVRVTLPDLRTVSGDSGIFLPKSVTPMALGTSCDPPWRAYWSAALATLSGGLENSKPGSPGSEYVSVVKASDFGLPGEVVNLNA